MVTLPNGETLLGNRIIDGSKLWTDIVTATGRAMLVMNHENCIALQRKANRRKLWYNLMEHGHLMGRDRDTIASGKALKVGFAPLEGQ